MRKTLSGKLNKSKTVRHIKITAHNSKKVLKKRKRKKKNTKSNKNLSTKS